MNSNGSKSNILYSITSIVDRNYPVIEPMKRSCVITSMRYIYNIYSPQQTQCFKVFFNYAAPPKEFETEGKHTLTLQITVVYFQPAQLQTLSIQKGNIVVASNAVKSLLLSTPKPLQDVLHKDCKNELDI